MIAMRKLKRAGSLGLGDDRARNLHDGGGEHRDGSTPRKRQGADLVVRVGAGEGNRTLMTSLEGRWCENPSTRNDVLTGLLASSARE